MACETLHHDEDAVCAICCELLEEMPVSQLPCLHQFHFRCIAQWVAAQHSCPLCRSPVQTVRNVPCCWFPVERRHCWNKVNPEHGVFCTRHMKVPEAAACPQKLRPRRQNVSFAPVEPDDSWSDWCHIL